MAKLFVLFCAVFLGACGGGGGGGSGASTPASPFTSSVNGDEIAIAYQGQTIAVFHQGNCSLELDPANTITLQVGPFAFVCPSYWESGVYHESAAASGEFLVNANGNGEVDFKGTNGNLTTTGSIIFQPPQNMEVITANISASTFGGVDLDPNFSGQSFQPLTFITMNEGQNDFASIGGSADRERFTFPSSGKVNANPIQASNFGVLGGSSNETGANSTTPTLVADFGQETLLVNGFVTQTNDPNTLNVLWWGASPNDTVLPQWSYTLVASPPSP